MKADTGASKHPCVDASTQTAAAAARAVAAQARATDWKSGRVAVGQRVDAADAEWFRCARANDALEEEVPIRFIAFVGRMMVELQRTGEHALVREAIALSDISVVARSSLSPEVFRVYLRKGMGTLVYRVAAHDALLHALTASQRVAIHAGGLCL
jgi:hypothetical protein